MNREILRLAIPNIISNISVPLLSTVDTALMGHLSAVHLGAVGLGAMMFNFLYWNFGFLRMGTTGMTAQVFGRNDESGISDILWRSLLLALGIAFFLVALYPLYFDGLILMLNVSDIHIDLVSEYFGIRIWAAPATLILYALMGWFFGMQDAVSPLVITVIVNITNIVFSYFLVHTYSMDIVGVAIGTVIAQYVGLFVAVGVILVRYRKWVEWMPNYIFAQSDKWISFFVVNRDLFIRTVCLTAAFVVFYRVSSSMGAVVLAAHVVLLQYIHWLAYAVDGYAYAAESIVGKYYGQKEYERVEEAVFLILSWGAGLAISYTIILHVFKYDVIAIFTTETGVIDYIFGQYDLVLLTPILAFGCYVWDGIYIGLLRTRIMRDSMILSIAIYVLLVYFILGDVSYGLWISFMIFLAIRGLSLALFWYYKVRIRLYD